MAIVTEVSEHNIKKLQSNYHKEEEVSKDEFFKMWDGSYLIAEPNKVSGEPNYAKLRRRYLFDSLIPMVAFAFIIMTSLWLLKRNIFLSGTEGVSTNAGIYIQYFITIAGMITSIALLWYEIDRNNPLLKKVCTGIKNGSCGAILTSKGAKVFGGISWSEIGFFYFAGAFLSLTLAGGALLPMLSLIVLLNVLAVVYPFYSIYYQWRIAKQWCVLCLVVQALIIMGAVNIWIFRLLSPVVVTTTAITQCLLLYIVPVLVWYILKPYILKLQEAKNTKREYLRLKFNPEVFESLLQKQRRINVPVDGLGIDLGKPDAKNILIKVCNPYCGPCSKAHPEIEKLLHQVPDLKAKIIFTTENDEKHHAIDITRHLMAIATLPEQYYIKEALDAWYNTEYKDYDVFAARYPLNGELALQGSKIKAMDQWCKKMKIEYTPTIFINGYPLPSAYTAEDLQYFLLE